MSNVETLKTVFVSALEACQSAGTLYYAPATTDANFKKITLNINQEVSRDFCNAMLAIEMPDISLSTRTVNILDEHVSREHRNTYIAFSRYIDDYLHKVHKSKNEPQELKVDALIETTLENISNGNQVYNGNKKAYCLNEMQVSEQDFARRLISYITKILSGEPIDQSKDQFPGSIYACGICMYKYNKNDQEEFAIKRFPVWNSNAVDPVNHPNKEQFFVEIAGCNIYLDKPANINPLVDMGNMVNQKRNNLKEYLVGYFESIELNKYKAKQKTKTTLERYQSLPGNKKNSHVLQSLCTKLFRALPSNQGGVSLSLEEQITHLAQDEDLEPSIKRIIEKLEDEAFKETHGANLEERFAKLRVNQQKAYFWLELIAFAHVMSLNDVKNSLGILKKEDRKPLKKAYAALRLNIDLLKGQNMNTIESGFPEFSKEMIQKLIDDPKVIQALSQLQANQRIEEANQRTEEANLAIAVMQYTLKQPQHFISNEKLRELICEKGLGKRTVEELVAAMHKNNGLIIQQNGEGYTVDA